MAGFMSAEIARSAVQVLMPSMEVAMSAWAKRYAGHLRVSYRGDDVWSTLATHNFGNPTEWEYDYESFAKSKEAISQRTGRNSREVQLMHPEMLEVGEMGDTVYYGSVVSEDGNIVVAYSGVESYFDEMFGYWVLYACLALIQHAQEKQKAEGRDYYYYVLR